jgi:hypothetical protein
MKTDDKKKRAALKALLETANAYAYRGQYETGTELGMAQYNECEDEYFRALNTVEDMLGLERTKP